MFTEGLKSSDIDISRQENASSRWTVFLTTLRIANNKCSQVFFKNSQT